MIQETIHWFFNENSYKKSDINKFMESGQQANIQLIGHPVLLMRNLNQSVEK